MSRFAVKGRSAKQLWRAQGPTYKARPYRIGKGIMRATGIRLLPDELVGMGRGYRPSLAMRNLEARATILGGAIALQQAGVMPWAGMNLDQMRVRIGATRKKREELLEISGGKSLAEGAERIRLAVAKRGLDELAWSYRSLLIFDIAERILKGAQAAAAVGAAAVQVIPAAGQIASLVPLLVGARAGVSASITQANKARAQQQISAALEQMAAKRELAFQQQAAIAARQQQLKQAKLNTYLVYGASGMVLLGLLLAAKRK
jgi:hypothetical protein